MDLDLVDTLRCTRDHADSWLVAAVGVRDARPGGDGGGMVSGSLGCPICFREYPVREGVAYFGVDPGGEASLTTAGATAEQEAAVRAGGLLAVAEGATVVLHGPWSAAAAGLAELLPVRLYVVNPATPVAASERIAVVRSAEGIPLATGSAHGVALGGAAITPLDVASALRVLAPGGRLVAPVVLPVPASLRELARDDRDWVAERAPPLIALRRG